MANPAFSTNPAFNGKGVPTIPTPTAEQLQTQFELPSAPDPAAAAPMTVDGTVRTTLGTFAVLLLGAAVGWVTLTLVPFLFIGAAIVGFVLALVNIFKKEPSPALILAYAAAQGVFLGGISLMFESQWSGIVAQAVIGTLAVVGVTLALFASGKVRASKRATKIFMIAMIGYLVFSLVNLVLMWTGVAPGAFGLRSQEIFGIPLGLIIGVLVVIMAAYSLVLDFDSIQQGVRNGAPRQYGWLGGFGIMVTVVWLYLEILRIIAIARSN
jgi:uncharacterized YccA/Bax inhibitor family protein